jgi:hypothetical protein
MPDYIANFLWKQNGSGIAWFKVEYVFNAVFLGCTERDQVLITVPAML